ncbi:unnamed protein product [Protopolystoma xenopodis]|uniref:Uncharacterized protein n=1 Tax=Protopolystoma xenopodis TaxID=117903 RepID=A0A3S5CJ24_9PLAT|nr:unnamed protein product [Protopolystoma xenopodis]
MRRSPSPSRSGRSWANNARPVNMMPYQYYPAPVPASLPAADDRRVDVMTPRDCLLSMEVPPTSLYFLCISSVILHQVLSDPSPYSTLKNAGRWPLLPTFQRGLGLAHTGYEGNHSFALEPLEFFSHVHTAGELYFQRKPFQLVANYGWLVSCVFSQAAHSSSLHSPVPLPMLLPCSQDDFTQSGSRYGDQIGVVAFSCIVSLYCLSVCHIARTDLDRCLSPGPQARTVNCIDSQNRPFFILVTPDTEHLVTAGSRGDDFFCPPIH